MEELTYIIKRILQMIPVLLIITLIIFFGMRLIPGDPALLLVGNRASDEAWSFRTALCAVFSIFEAMSYL